jgi:LPS-assembly protein
MPNRLRQSWILLFVIAVCFRAGMAQAQQPGAPATADTTTADRHDVISDKQHHFLGKVEMHRGDTTLFADEVWYYPDEDRAIATGNVLLRQGTNQISADRADFTLGTRLGTFYNASGFATIQPMRQMPRPGTAALPSQVGQESVVYFFGDTVEKIGTRKYKIVDGGFTTCVQPTARWDFHADTVILNVDHYTFLRNMVMTVKGVPMLYLPVMYYPTNKGDRATGFLIPTYGVTTIRGQSFHNAFFWAINRSQDATIAYDWFSKAGNGVGTEYRYNLGGGNDGTIRSYVLDQKETTYPNPDGSTATLPSLRSYEVHGSANETLPFRLRARGRVDYFSSLTTMQTFNTNVAAATQSQRSFGGNVVGAWNVYSLNATFDHTEYFYNSLSSGISGGWPRINLTRNERPIPGTPFYVSVGGEFVNILSDRKDETTGTLIEQDLGLMRVDFVPQIRFPFKKWQWFTVNSTASWRDTGYSRSLDAGGNIVDEPLNRKFFTVASQITGPVFTRIWDTPDNGYAEKFKHSIEPFVNVQRTSAIDNYDNIVKLEGVDQIVGGTTQYTYGVTNRFYAKVRSNVPGRPALAREIFTIDLQQTYYTDDRAAQIDRQYVTSNSGAPPSNFSPIALNIRATPAADFNASLRAEFDSTYKALRTVSVGAQYSWSQMLQTTLGWSKKNFIPQLSGFNDPTLLDQSLNATTNVHTRDNKYGSLYSFNYDVLHSTLLQQRITGFYNAQCCGIAFEYQAYHFLSSAVSPVPADHRFFLSFTLAGLGNFSPFNGALSGVPR